MSPLSPSPYGRITCWEQWGIKVQRCLEVSSCFKDTTLSLPSSSTRCNFHFPFIEEVSWFLQSLISLAGSCLQFWCCWPRNTYATLTCALSHQVTIDEASPQVVKAHISSLHKTGMKFKFHLVNLWVGPAFDQGISSRYCFLVIRRWHLNWDTQLRGFWILPILSSGRVVMINREEKQVHQHVKVSRVQNWYVALKLQWSSDENISMFTQLSVCGYDWTEWNTVHQGVYSQWRIAHYYSTLWSLSLDFSPLSPRDL